MKEESTERPPPMSNETKMMDEIIECTGCDECGAELEADAGDDTWLGKCPDCKHRPAAPVIDAGVYLSKDDQEQAVWQAIQDIKFGNKTDDKMIVQNLHEKGFYIAVVPPPSKQPATDAALDALKRTADRAKAFGNKHSNDPALYADWIDRDVDIIKAALSAEKLDAEAFDKLKEAEKAIGGADLSGIPVDLAKRIVTLKKWAQDVYHLKAAHPQLFKK